MMYHSKWGVGGELLYVQLRHSQEGAVCTYGGLCTPGVEQVLFMLQVLQKFSKCYAMTRGGFWFFYWAGSLNYLEILF